MSGYSSKFDGATVDKTLNDVACHTTTEKTANQWYAFLLGDDIDTNNAAFSGLFSFQVKYADNSCEQLTFHLAATYDTVRGTVANVTVLKHVTNGDAKHLVQLGFDCNETVAVEADKIYSAAIKCEGDFQYLKCTGSMLINCSVADLSISTGGALTWDTVSLV